MKNWIEFITETNEMIRSNMNGEEQFAKRCLNNNDLYLHGHRKP